MYKVSSGGPPLLIRRSAPNMQIVESAFPFKLSYDTCNEMSNAQDRTTFSYVRATTRAPHNGVHHVDCTRSIRYDPHARPNRSILARQRRLPPSDYVISPSSTSRILATTPKPVSSSSRPRPKADHPTCSPTRPIHVATYTRTGLSRTTR